jgi:hypothetical protein
MNERALLLLSMMMMNREISDTIDRSPDDGSIAIFAEKQECNAKHVGQFIKEVGPFRAQALGDESDVPSHHTTGNISFQPNPTQPTNKHKKQTIVQSSSSSSPLPPPPPPPSYLILVHDLF